MGEMSLNDWDEKSRKKNDQDDFDGMKQEADCYLAPTVWNDLPLDTRLYPTTDIFKHRLKTPVCISYQCCPPSDCRHLRFSFTTDFCVPYKLLYYYYCYFIFFAQSRRLKIKQLRLDMALTQI